MRPADPAGPAHPPGHVVIAGASGVIGRAATCRFAQAGWQVTALSRRDPQLGQSVRHIAVDLMDGGACVALAHQLRDVTHLVYAAVFEEDDLVEGWRSRRQMDTNLAMLRNIAAPLSGLGTLRHVSIFQGTKAYGVHLKPIRVPAREVWPRHDHDNFYWLQEDFLRELARISGFAVTIWRPQVVFGDAIGVVMNVLPVLGAYAALEAAEGRGFGWPGGPPYLLEAVDARLIADALLWAATAETARNQTFNITNGDVFIWQNIWPVLAAAFGAAPGKDRPQRLARTMPPRAEGWARIAQKFGLACDDLAALMGRSHHYADFTFATGARRQPEPALVSTIKLRQAGFAGCIDTETMFSELIHKLQDLKILPPLGALKQLMEREITS